MADEHEGGKTGGENNDRPWLTSIPETLRGHEAFKDKQSLEDVFKSFTSLSEKSKGMVMIPDEKADENTIKAFRKAIGVPESIEDYGLEKPETIEGLTYDETFATEMLQTLYEAGAPKSVVQAMFKKYNDYQTNLYKKFTEHLDGEEQKSIDNLKNFWKGDFEKKNRETFEVFKRALDKINIPDEMGGTKGLLEDIENFGIRNSARWNVFFNALFEAIGNDSWQSSSRTNVDTPAGERMFSSYQKMNQNNQGG